MASKFQQVYVFVYNDDKRCARELCDEMLQEPDIHLFYQVKCHLMLAGFADIPPVAEIHFNEAKKFCTQLYENRKDGEEEEILTYRAMIDDGKKDLGPEMRQWKLEEGIYITSSEEDEEEDSG